MGRANGVCSDIFAKEGLDLFSCRRSSVVERTLGKGEVTGSNPVGGFGIMRYCRRSAVTKKMVSVDDRRTNWLGR